MESSVGDGGLGDHCSGPKNMVMSYPYFCFCAPSGVCLLVLVGGVGQSTTAHDERRCVCFFFFYVVGDKCIAFFVCFFAHLDVYW